MGMGMGTVEDAFRQINTIRDVLSTNHNGPRREAKGIIRSITSAHSINKWLNRPIQA